MRSPKTIRLQGGFVRRVSWLTGGTVGGQLLVLALSPVLTRLYRPEDFGALGIFAALLAFLTVLATLRYELALPLADDVDADRLFVLILIIVAMSVIGAAIVVVALGSQLLSILNADAIRSHVWLLPVGVGAAGVLQALTYLGIRDRQYARLGAARFGQAAAASLSQLGMAGFGAVGLLVGYIGGRVVAAAILTRRVPVVTLKSVLGVALERRRFPIFTMSGSLINAVGLQLPVLILASAFGTATVGLFSLTLRVTQAPLAVVGQATSQVFLGGLAEAQTNQAVRQYAWRTFATLSVLTIPPVGLAMIWAPDAFAIAFGTAWRPAGDMAVFLLPWVVLSLIGQPLSSLAFALGAQRRDLGIQATLAGLRLAALTGATLVGDEMLAVQAFGLVSATIWSLYLVWLIGLTGTPAVETFRHVAFVVSAALLVAIPSAAARMNGDAISVVLGSAASLALLVTILFVAWSRRLMAPRLPDV